MRGQHGRVLISKSPNSANNLATTCFIIHKVGKVILQGRKLSRTSERKGLQLIYN